MMKEVIHQQNGCGCETLIWLHLSACLAPHAISCKQLYVCFTFLLVLYLSLHHLQFSILSLAAESLLDVDSGDHFHSSLFLSPYRQWNQDR